MRGVAAFAVGVFLVASGTGLAEDRGNVSGGYRFAQSNGLGYPAGWYADVTGHMNDLLSIVGDIGGAYKGSSVPVGGFAQEMHSRIHTFMGGVKVNVRTRDEDIVAFGQALVGAASLRTRTTSGLLTLSRSATEPALGLSAGTDVNGGLPVALRFQIGWVRVFEDEAANIFTFSVGAKFGF